MPCKPGTKSLHILQIPGRYRLP
uniref:Uncharacterized protein n=1 Tax=Anguilla anguilla TaxID=7936 RepID=A0A0E9XSI9_ANGAN